MRLLLENTLPAERMAGCAFAEMLKSAADVTRNGGTIVGNAPSNGIFTGNGASYITYHGSEKRQITKMSILIKDVTSPSDITTESAILSSLGVGGAPATDGFTIDWALGRLYCFIGGATPHGYIAATTNTNYGDISYVYDGAGATNADKLKMYINGVLQVLTFTGTIPTSFNISYRITIGAWTGVTYKLISGGKVGEVRIFYGTALSADSVLAYANGTMWSYDRNCVLWMDGKMTNYDPTHIDKVDKVTNGSFTAWTGDNPDSWTVPPEAAGYYVTQVGNACRVVSDGTNIYVQQGGLTVGKTYYFTLNVRAVVSGSLKIASSITVYGTYNTIGVKTGYFVADSVTFAIGRVAGATDVTFTDVRVYEVFPAHRDASKAGNDLEFGDRVTTTTFPTKNTTPQGGYNFDGGDYMVKDYVNTLDSCTLSAFFKPNVMASSGIISLTNSSTQRREITFFSNGIFLIIYGDAKYRFCTTVNRINKPIAITVIFNGASAPSVYLNGIPEAVAAEGPSSYGTANKINVGRYGSAGGSLTGSIYKSSIHTTALNQIQINDLYHRFTQDMEV